MALGFLAAVCLSLEPGSARAAELQPQTLEAWKSYIQVVDQAAKARAHSRANFLWLRDDRARVMRARQGAVEVQPAGKRGAIAVPGGLIHDWIGGEFIPDVSLDQVLSIVREYDRYKDYFNPEVAVSKVRQLTPGGDEFTMTVVNKVLFVSVGLDGEYRAENVRLDGGRAYSTSYTTRVREIRNYGQAEERELAPDQGDGYIWRLYSTTRFEEKDGGVYVEMEAIALTRDVPATLRILVMPVVKRLSRNSLLISLEKTRAALRSSAETAATRPAQLPTIKPAAFRADGFR